MKLLSNALEMTSDFMYGSLNREAIQKNLSLGAMQTHVVH